MDIGYATTADFFADDVPGVVELQRLGLITPGQSQGFYALTEQARKCLLPVTVIQHPKPLHKFIRSVAPSQLSLIELISSLGDSGWQDVCVQSKSNTPPFKPDGEKVWYQHQNASKISANYLRVLLQSSDLFKSGLQEIHHFQLESSQG